MAKHYSNDLRLELLEAHDARTGSLQNLAFPFRGEICFVAPCAVSSVAVMLLLWWCTTEGKRPELLSITQNSELTLVGH